MLLVPAGVVCGAVVLLGALVGLHLAAPGLSPLTDPVSRYALTRCRAGGSAAVAGAGTAVLLARLPGGAAAAALLWIFVAARALISWFPMDAPETRVTLPGRAHDILAVAAFATVTAAALVAVGPLAVAGHTFSAHVSTVAGIP